MALTFFIKKYENHNATGDQRASSRKRAQRSEPDLDPKADFPRGEFATSPGTCENSPPQRKTSENAIVNISKVLGTFRSHFGAQASNPKANRRANRRSLAATAGNHTIGIESGGQMTRFWEKNHCFKNRVDLIKK